MLLVAPGKFTYVLALQVGFGHSFRVRSTSKDVCCCKDASVVTREKCSEKGYKWVESSEAQNRCCTLFKGTCPRLSLRSGFSKYRKASIETCAGHTRPTKDFNKEQKGAYLTYTTHSHGTLTVTWSTTKIDGALAYISTKKDVPSFKFGPSGREETRETGDSSQLSYRRAFASFVKLGKRFDGTLTLYQHARVKVILLDSKNVVKIVEPGSKEPLVDKKAVAVVHRQASGFKVTTMVPGLFTDTARSLSSMAIQM